MAKTERILGSLIDTYSLKELKSTQEYDRDFFYSVDFGKIISYKPFAHKYNATSDKEYLDVVILFIQDILFRHPEIQELEIYADFNKLGVDTTRIENIFSRKLTHTFCMNIIFEFKNSKAFRSIQIADLIVGTYRRGLKNQKN